jgi:hypothetical protein
VPNGHLPRANFFFRLVGPGPFIVPPQSFQFVGIAQKAGVSFIPKCWDSPKKPPFFIPKCWDWPKHGVFSIPICWDRSQVPSGKSVTDAPFSFQNVGIARKKVVS